MNAVHVSTSNVASTAIPTPASIKPAPTPNAPRPITLKDLIPAAVRDRKFRAHSFGASLTREQRVQLFEWLGEDSLSEVQAKVAAPAPHGFGLKVNRTTLQRLRNSAENVELSDAVIDAMDSACDVLDPEIVADAAPLRETLSLLLYSRAVKTAQDASAIDLNRIITAIGKLDKLKPAAATRPQPIARLKVDLTVSNPHREPTIVQSVSATPERPIQSTPTLALESAPAKDDQEPTIIQLPAQHPAQVSTAASPAPFEPANIDTNFESEPLPADRCEAGEPLPAGNSSRTEPSENIPSPSSAPSCSAIRSIFSSAKRILQNDLLSRKLGKHIRVRLGLTVLGIALSFVIRSAIRSILSSAKRIFKNDLLSRKLGKLIHVRLGITVLGIALTFVPLSFVIRGGSPSHPDSDLDPDSIASAPEIFQKCNLQTPPNHRQSEELETLLAVAQARGIDLASLDR